MSEVHEEAVSAQRASDAAWACLTAYRQRVDGRRQATPGQEGRLGPWVRDWLDREHKTYARLHARVVAAAEARRAAMAKHGIPSTWATERALRKAAREPDAS